MTRQLPPSAVAAIALSTMFVAITALAATFPRLPREAPSDVLAAAARATASPTFAPTTVPPPVLRPAPTPSLEMRPPPLRSGVDRPTVPPRPKPEPAPVALSVAPEAGGIVFRHCCEKGQLQGVWRYDGATGTVRRIGVNGEPTADGRGYVVRQDDGHFVRVDAATGSTEAIAPLGATSADAAPTSSDLVSAYVEGATWVVPRAGEPRRVAGDLSVSTVRVSPDGRRLALVVGIPNAYAVNTVNAHEPPRIPTELWALDLPDGAPRRLVRLQQGSMGPQIQLGPWSPDGTLLAYWEVSISNSINADGVRLRAVDVRSGTTYDLGTTLFGASRLSWKPPHTLAYVSGGSRMTWDHKTVRIWSPETGPVDVNASGIGLNPSWSADGRSLYLITADEHDYDPVPYFAARDSGDRRLSVYDAATRRITTSAGLADRVYEGARGSRDGASVLVIWRAAYAARSLQELPPITMTLGLLDLSTGRVKELVRIAGDVGFGYYGSYEGPEGMAWSMGR